MYFDHAVCPSCKSQFDPEKIVASGGRAACPSCNAALDLKSMFGVADAFVGVGDDEGIGLTLDDALKSHPRPKSGGAPSGPGGESAPAGGGEVTALEALRRIREDRD